MAKKSKLQSLERAYRILENDLKRAGGGIPDLMDSPRALQVMLNPRNNAARRSRFVLDLMTRSARITGAISAENEPTPHRFAAAPIGVQDDFRGILLMCFSREFVELERQVVATRAKIMALKQNLEITEMKALNDEVPAVPVMHFIGAEESWDGTVERTRILYRRNCIQYFCTLTEEELKTGRMIAIGLREKTLENLGASAEKKFPNPAEIHTYINELDDPDGNRTKQLIAIPYAESPRKGHTIH